MLNCISGMVEKTQSAISILQQRQSEAGNVRTAEELVAEVQVLLIVLPFPPSPCTLYCRPRQTWPLTR